MIFFYKTLITIKYVKKTKELSLIIENAIIPYKKINNNLILYIKKHTELCLINKNSSLVPYIKINNNLILYIKKHTELCLINKNSSIIPYIKINNNLILYVFKPTGFILIGVYDFSIKTSIIRYINIIRTIVLFSKKTNDFVLINFDQRLINITKKVTRSIIKRYPFYLDPQFVSHIKLRSLNNYKCYEVITKMYIPHDFEIYLGTDKFHPLFTNLFFNVFMNQNVIKRVHLYVTFTNNVSISLFAHSDFNKYHLRKALVYASKMYSRICVEEDTEYFKFNVAVYFLLKLEIILNES